MDTTGLGYDHGNTWLRSGRGQDPWRRGLGVGKMSSVELEITKTQEGVVGERVKVR